MKFSSLVERIAGDGVDAWDVHYRAMARVDNGEDVILLSVGQEGDQFTPQPIVEAAVESLRSGRHHYMPIEGSSDVRGAIVGRHNRLTGQDVSRENVAVFNGAQNALFAVSQCLLEAGDEVILLEPYYTTYPASVSACGAEIVAVPVKAENSFQIDPLDIANAITPKTRMILLNSPNNPTGAVYTRAQFEAVAALCIEHDIWLVSDEVYQEIIPVEGRFSPASIPAARAVCITISSLSKSHRMTGWRFGWVVAPPAVIRHLYNLSLCMSYGLPGFIQDAAVVALNEDFETAGLVAEQMLSRRVALVDAFKEIEGVELFSAEGGMFVVLNIRSLSISSMEFAEGLLDQYDVAVLPCDGFGASGAGLLRVSLCAPVEQLVEAAGRIKKYVANCR